MVAVYADAGGASVERAVTGPRSAQLLCDILQRGTIENGDYDALGIYWRPLLDVLKAAGEMPMAEAFLEALQSWPDGTEVQAAVFACAAGDPVPASDDPDNPRFRLLTFDEMVRRKPPEWLIDGVLQCGGIAALYGPPETYKSFIAIDIALTIATGVKWAGRRVKQGKAVYVAGEGGSGLGLRLEAWRRHRGRKPDETEFYVLPEAPRLLNQAMAGDAEQFVSIMVALKPALVVLDTWAWVLIGGDENSSKDTGLALDILNQIRRETGATILIVHHVTRATGSLRGSTALPGALETEIEVTKDHTTGVILKCTKQKDADHFPAIVLVMSLLDTGLADEVGRPLTSLIFDVSPLKEQHRSGTLIELLGLLDDRREQGASTADWRTTAELVGISRSNFWKLVNKLLDDHDVVKVGDGRNVRYVSARYAVSPLSPLGVHSDESRPTELSPLSPPPFKGVDTAWTQWTQDENTTPESASGETDGTS